MNLDLFNKAICDFSENLKYDLKAYRYALQKLKDRYYCLSLGFEEIENRILGIIVDCVDI